MAGASPGCRVTIHCKAMTWDGSNTATAPFCDSNTGGKPLSFVVGAGQVTKGLDAGIQR